MSIFDSIFGINNARVRAPTINTQAGTAALGMQQQRLGEQLAGQQYSLAAGARGSNATMALREAQRRSAMGQAQLGGMALEQQRQLEQQAAGQNAQMSLAAQTTNAGIEGQNAQALSRGIGSLASAAGTAMMFSDIRAKEDIHPYRMLSDFLSKEPAALEANPYTPAPSAGRAAFGLNRDPRPTSALYDAAQAQAAASPTPTAQYIPQDIRPGVDPRMLENAAIATHLRDRREANEMRDQAVMADAARQGPSAVQTAGVSQADAARAAYMDQLFGRQREAAGESQAYGGKAFGRTAQGDPNPFAVLTREYGSNMIQSDKKSKEMLREGLSAGLQAAAGATGASMPTLSRVGRLPRPAVTVVPGPAPIEYATQPTAQLSNAELAARLQKMRAIDPNISGATQQPPPRVTGLIPSDFRLKEPMSAAESDRALSPIMPVNYRYKPEASARMAAEASPDPNDQAFVYADKRAPRDGIIAQNLEQSPAFRGSVVDTDVGKKVDMERAVSTNLAATAGLEKRIDELEQLLRKGRAA